MPGRRLAIASATATAKAARISGRIRIRSAGLAVSGLQHLQHVRWLSVGSATDVVGLGASSGDLSSSSRTHLLNALMSAIDHPGRLIVGVTSVTVRPAVGEAGEDGALWRTMTVEGERVVEHIYANPAAGEVRFVPLDADEREGDTEIVHALRRSPLRLEYFQRCRRTGERLHWDTPMHSALRSIEATVTLARAKEAQDGDSGFFGNKA